MAARLQQGFLAADDAAAHGSSGAGGAAAPSAGSRALYDDELDAGGPATGVALCVLLTQPMSACPCAWPAHGILALWQ